MALAAPETENVGAVRALPSIWLWSPEVYVRAGTPVGFVHWADFERAPKIDRVLVLARPVCAVPDLALERLLRAEATVTLQRNLSLRNS